MRFVLLVLVCASCLVRAAGAAAPQSREESVTLYETMYLGSAGTPSGWTGDVATCDAGDVSAAYRAAGIQRTDYFRIMAGLPAGLGLDATKSSACQEAALMMTAKRTLDHFPDDTWTCYTVDGAAAAGKSNLALGYDSLADAIRGWMRDVSTPSAGHRRWILYPPLGSVGLGATFQGQYNAYAMQVIGTLAGVRPGEPEWVAWPPPGWVPFPLVWEYWSLAYNGTANFAGAAVTVTRDGQPVGVNVQTLANGYGDNTLVWSVSGLPMSSPPASDVTYHVTVSNVSGVPSSSYEYDVVVIDPGTPTPVVPVTWGAIKARYLPGETGESGSTP